MDNNSSPRDSCLEHFSAHEGYYRVASPQQIVQQQFPDPSLACSYEEFAQFLDLLLDGIDTTSLATVSEVASPDLAPACRSFSAMSNVSSIAGASDIISSVASTLAPITPSVDESDTFSDSPEDGDDASDAKTYQDLGGLCMEGTGRDGVDENYWAQLGDNGALRSATSLGTSPFAPSLGPQRVGYAQPQWQEPDGSAEAVLHSIDNYNLSLHGDPRASTLSPSTLSCAGAHWGAQTSMVPKPGEPSPYLPVPQRDSAYEATGGIEPYLLSLSQPAFRSQAVTPIQGQETTPLQHSWDLASVDVPGQGTPSAALDLKAASPTGRKRSRSKMYPCPVSGCSYEDARTYNVRVHVSRVHHGERPFLCDFPGCDRKKKGFSRKENLQAHLEKNHGVPRTPKQERSLKAKKSM
ncbi:hypothetical protein C8Q80DRAFT_1275130 [Daedaleopsis nitida]|nr:hypothetical protein C8Q80DRAFT_1275130 [Daedaleopsis nitida]